MVAHGGNCALPRNPVYSKVSGSPDYGVTGYSRISGTDPGAVPGASTKDTSTKDNCTLGVRAGNVVNLGAK